MALPCGLPFSSASLPTACRQDSDADAAQIAADASADLLVMLSNIEGVFSDAPGKKGAQLMNSLSPSEVCAANQAVACHRSLSLLPSQPGQFSPQRRDGMIWILSACYVTTPQAECVTIQQFCWFLRPRCFPKERGLPQGSPPPPETADPGVVKQDKSARGSVDTTKTRSDPQRVGMCSGERPIGAAKGKQTKTMASCQNPPPSCHPGPLKFGFAL